MNMIDTITKFLNQYDLDVRKSHDARFMDQKCTPDVVCFIADCLINLNRDARSIAHLRYEEVVACQ